LARKEYRTLTIRVEVYERFLKLAKEMRKKDYQMYHTQVLDHLIDVYEKKSK